MSTRTKNDFPAGWDKQRVREVLEYYEAQTDEEAANEHQAALPAPAHCDRGAERIGASLPAADRPTQERADAELIRRGQ